VERLSTCCGEPIRWDIYKRSVKLGERGAAEELKSANEIGAQNLDRSRDTGSAAGAKSVGIRASYQHSPRAETQRFYNVAASPDSTIQQDLDAIPYAGKNAGSDILENKREKTISEIRK